MLSSLLATFLPIAVLKTPEDISGPKAFLFLIYFLTNGVEVFSPQTSSTCVVNVSLAYKINKSQIFIGKHSADKQKQKLLVLETFSGLSRNTRLVMLMTENTTKCCSSILSLVQFLFFIVLFCVNNYMIMNL